MPEENLVLFPLTACGAASMPGGNVMLHVECITDPLHALEDAQSLRFAMTAAQAAGIAKALLKAADEALERPDASDGPTH